MNIVFFGGGKFAAPSLAALAKNFKIALVVTNPEKPTGRRQIPEPSAVEIEAKKLELSVIVTEKFNDGLANTIKAANPSFFIVVDYGKIIPREILGIPPLGAINVHPSALPKYRGASPLQTAISNGETKTAISIMLMDDQVDHGPILAQKKEKILPNDTYGSLYGRLSEEYPYFLVETLKKYLSGEIKPIPQKNSEATFTKLLSREDGRIDWSKSAEEIERMVRAYDPWPGTFTEWRGKRIKILKAGVVPRPVPTNTRPGDFFETPDKQLAVSCGGSGLILNRIQPEGKKPISGEEFARGYLKA
jgi:methionyl-tRNA formyltransferase